MGEGEPAALTVIICNLIVCIQTNLAQNLYIGIAVQEGSHGTLDVGFVSHDGTYSMDFAVNTLMLNDQFDGSEVATPASSRNLSSAPISSKGLPHLLADFLIDKLMEYREEHSYKYIGAGINERAVHYSPQLPSRLWQELDIVPLVLEGGPTPDKLRAQRGPKSIHVDEEADTMARKALMYFGPSSQPRLTVGYKNLVEVDCSGRVSICNADDFRNSVRDTTWKATTKYVESLKANKVQIAFFNSTPQGGGVALMRHALIRLLRIMGVDASW
jgi:hypothetical protein